MILDLNPLKTALDDATQSASAAQLASQAQRHDLQTQFDKLKLLLDSGDRYNRVMQERQAARIAKLEQALRSIDEHMHVFNGKTRSAVIQIIAEALTA